MVWGVVEVITDWIISNCLVLYLLEKNQQLILYLNTLEDVVKAAWIPGYQNTEYKAEPVWYSSLYAYSATGLIACH